MKEFIAFTGFDWLLDHFKPLTPMGRLAKERLAPLSKPELEQEFALVSDFVTLIKTSPVRADKMEFHLNRIPALDGLPPEKPDCAEIFAIKKFLSNARDIFALLPCAPAEKLGVRWTSSALIEELTLGGGEETFHVADKASPALAKTRAALAVLTGELAVNRRNRFKKLQKTYDLDFSCRDFIVLDEEAAEKLFGNPDFFIEPYDCAHLTVKPVPGSDYLALASRRDALLREEKEEETRVISALAKKIGAQSASLNRYAAQLEKIDLLLAKARLALRFKMTKPQIRPAGAALSIKNGRLLPLENRLACDGLAYVPLNCKLDGRVGILTGSNMGGKTVALQTIGFLQLCMQLGFYAPAGKYAAPLFEALHFVGESPITGKVEGLSSFGLELYSFMQAWRDSDKHTLILMDEFARATNSAEAAALLSAVAQSFCAKKGIYAFISTHFSGLDAKQAGFYRMKGFDESAFEKHGHLAGDLRGQLRQINKFMRYELVADTGQGASCDALKVARLLGFDKHIAALAKHYLEAK